MTDSIQIGYLLRSSTTGFVVGCSVSQLKAPALGALLRVPLDKEFSVYGLVTDIHIEDDGLVRQLVTAGNVNPEVMHDNRERRIVPVEMSVLAVGYEQGGMISHLLPPRPPSAWMSSTYARIPNWRASQARVISGTSGISCKPRIFRSAKCWPRISWM